MSHVDDGELTAYADGAYQGNDPIALRISAHLSTCDNCRTRLEQNDHLRARAAEILGYATPGTVAIPEFDSLHAQVAPAKRWQPFPLAWAASIVLALGLGWFGRGAWQNPQLVMKETAAANTSPVSPPATNEESDLSTALSTPAPAPMEPTVAAADNARGAGTTTTAQAANAQSVESRQEQVMSAAPLAAAAAPPPPPAAPAPARVELQVGKAAGQAATAPLPMITGLPVLRVVAAGPATLVEQSLPDGKVVQLYISQEQDVAAKADARRRHSAAGAEAATPEVVVTRDGKTIILRGDVPADSLRALAKQIK